MGEGSDLNVADRRRPWRESDRAVGASRLGNASGAKDPDFWCALEDGEEKVIGDEPTNTRKRSGSFRESCIVRRRRSPPSASTRSTTRFVARTSYATPTNWPAKMRVLREWMG